MIYSLIGKLSEIFYDSVMQPSQKTSAENQLMLLKQVGKLTKEFFQEFEQLAFTSRYVGIQPHSVPNRVAQWHKLYAMLLLINSLVRPGGSVVSATTGDVEVWGILIKIHWHSSWWCPYQIDAWCYQNKCHWSHLHIVSTFWFIPKMRGENLGNWSTSKVKGWTEEVSQAHFAANRPSFIIIPDTPVTQIKTGMVWCGKLPLRFLVQTNTNMGSQLFKVGQVNQWWEPW